MRIKTSTQDVMIKSLVESFETRIMKVIIRKLIHGYNINERTGIPENMPIQKTEMARQIVRDIMNMNLFFRLASVLVDIHFNGITGRKYPVYNINGLIREVQGYGFLYDRENKMFVEDPSVTITKNWGIMNKGEEYIFTFLWIDIVQNTKLVKKFGQKLMNKAYADIHGIVKEVIQKRHGRIWIWEGDGGLVAFHFSNRNLLCVLSAMEIIHRLFLYNKLYSKFKIPLDVKVIVNTHPCEFSYDTHEIKGSDTMKQIRQIESESIESNTVTISYTTLVSLDPIIRNKLTKLDSSPGSKLWKYELKWEEA